MIDAVRFCQNSSFGKRIQAWIQHWDYNKYWNRRCIVVDPSNKTSILKKIYYLYYIKKIDAYHNCSFGTNLNSGAIFKSPPILPHGPNGIIIGHDCIIGHNCTIFQQVTIIQGGENVHTQIGDNCLIGAGAKILAGTEIGDNVRIGANCVAMGKVPNNATVVLPKPRILLKDSLL